MDYLKMVKDFSAALRARDYLKAAVLAADLIKAGVDLWSSWKTLQPGPVALVCPCNVDDDDAVADWCEIQTTAAMTASATPALPWNLLLPLLIQVLQRLLSN